MSHFKGNTGTLIIVVGRAKDLPNKRKLEKQNPYCLLRISNLTDKTKADLRGGQVPKWDEEFRFNIVPELQPILRLSVLDETKKAPTLIAEAEIDFTPVFYSSVKEGYDKWHALTSGSKEAGMIYLEMTFYPANGNTVSSPRKSMSMSSVSSSPKKRSLPPIPGQPELQEEPETIVRSIPPPLPRNPQQEFVPDFSRSQMSIHSLPDVPTTNHILKDLPPMDTRFTSSVSAESDGTIVSKPSDWISMAKKFTTKYTSSLFGKEEGSVNDFDQLEREVQSDFQRNNSSEKLQSKAPPVPSHSSGSFSGSFRSSPPPVPQHSSMSSKIMRYDIIEPTQPERQSPSRKAPFYQSGETSPARLNLSSIPYDVNDIGPSRSPTRGSPTQGPPRARGSPTRAMTFGEPLMSHRDNDILLLTHDSPTPYDVFVRSNGSTTSVGTNKSRMSPTRFKTSLPPPPQ
jgi:hypothetical protein